MLEIPMVSASWIPFLATVVDKRELSTQRIVEAMIIAALSAGGASFVTVTKMEARMDNMTASVARMEGTINAALIVIEKQRDLRDAQLDQLKGDIHRLKLELASRK